MLKSFFIQAHDHSHRSLLNPDCHQANGLNPFSNHLCYLHQLPLYVKDWQESRHLKDQHTKMINCEDQKILICFTIFASDHIFYYLPLCIVFYS